MAELEGFIPRTVGNKNCGDPVVSGTKSTRYDYIAKPGTNDDVPAEPIGGFEQCTPYVYGNAQIDNLRVNGTATGDFQGDFQGTCDLVGTINVQSWKGFDIKHPNKENHRLRHICLEGPEAGVYFRGRLTESNVIELPSYWKGLIDPESITVSLTQIGSSQDLIIDSIEWGSRIKIRSGNASKIDCYYVIHASRIDGEALIVEYEGQTPAEYPGNDSQYSISGYDYDVRG